MKTKRFTLTEEQQEELRKCTHIRKVSARMVQYTAEFKRYAIKERAGGTAPRYIFKQAGIPYYFGPNYAADRINDWKRIATKHGDIHFDTETRGRNGAVALIRYWSTTQAYKIMTDAEKIVYLEARNEALEYIARHFGLPPSIHRAHSSRRRKK